MSMTDPLKQFAESVDSNLIEAPYPSSPRLNKDIAWVSSHREELMKYEGKWVAVYEQKVIASGKNGAQAQKRALQKIGHDVPDLYIRFLERATCIY